MNFLKKGLSNISLFFVKIYLLFDKYIVKKLKEKDLLKRILFTLFIMIIFVVIGTITLPGVTVNNNASLESSDNFLGIMNTIGGGGMRRFSLVALGISPFITASLIMTFAQTKLCPPIYRLYQSGPAGRVKINYITYGITFVFAIIQGIIIIQSMNSLDYISISPQYDTNWFKWIVLPFVLVAGTFFSMFLAEQISNKGVGNGTSMLILAGSVISLPQYFVNAFNLWLNNKTNALLFTGIIYFIGFILLFVILIFIIAFFYQAERRVPIQQIGVGRSKNIKDISYLPIKLNPAGIMPIIFASMVISLPMMVVSLVNQLSPNNVTRWMIQYISLTNVLGLTIFASVTFLLTIFLSLQQSKIDKIVEDFNKASTFIPGVRPGEQTEDYLTSIVLRLSLFSAIYLTILGSCQYVVIIIATHFGKTQWQGVLISPTSLMIVVTVSIETMQQIQARYKALNIFGSKFKQATIKPTKNNNEINDALGGGSILW